MSLISRTVLAIGMAGILSAGCKAEEPVQAQKKEDTVKTEIKEHKSGEWTPNLSDEEKATLFQIVEDSLQWCVNGATNRFSWSKYKITDKMKEPTHSFVTLKINDDLRGCIGSLPPYPANKMYESVHQNAVLAATEDHRFRPVTPAELKKINVHISLLSPAKDIASIEDFKLGEHGIIFKKGSARSVFLPEVAVEQGWTREMTFSYLSQKAGLGRDAWKDGASFQVYTSVVLSRD
jgi:MEMO1 family protein